MRAVLGIPLEERHPQGGDDEAGIEELIAWPSEYAAGADRTATRYHQPWPVRMQVASVTQT